MSKATRQARKAALLQIVQGPGPLDNTPRNRKQRRQAARIVRRMQPGRGRRSK